MLLKTASGDRGILILQLNKFMIITNRTFMCRAKNIFSCFHMNLKNYALDVYEGYYKSIHGMMYCQGSFGPILVRREIYSNLMKSKKALSQVDLVLFFLQNPDLLLVVNKILKFFI